MLRTMLRPQWLAFLALVAAVVVAFLLLGRWQLNSAFDASGTAADTEAYDTPVPLGELIAPGGWLTDEAAARPITVEGFLVPGDFAVVEERLQNEESGVWVVAHLAVTSDGRTDYSGTDAAELPGLPLALGWAPDDATARAAIAEFESSMRAATGTAAAPLQLVATLEAPQDPDVARDGDPQRVLTMAPGQLINTWGADAGSYYAAWLLATDGVELPAGLAPISVVPIDDSLHIDALNIFYALEWLVFAGFAVYIWWRMVRDDYLRRRAENTDEAVAERVRRELLLEIAAERERREN